ncbi:MAG: 2-dehydropantoate 2-reductase [Candidatus Thermoplasmatota archaeon]
MNIVIFGAGALGSFFGGMLAKQHTVALLGREQHITMVRHHGLKISGKTRRMIHLEAVLSLKEVSFPPDLIIITVKSYDTFNAAQELSVHLNKECLLLTLQNGLGNIEVLTSYFPKQHILAGVTTQGVFYKKPGWVVHTGFGTTLIGDLSGETTDRVDELARVFSESGIPTVVSNHIYSEIWKKAIINASINPLTAFLRCKNGYLLKNPIIENVVEHICLEAAAVAKAEQINVDFKELLVLTKQVLQKTKNNYSSMVQSIQRGKQTEINEINQKFVEYGRRHGIETPLNTFMVSLIKNTPDYLNIRKR